MSEQEFEEGVLLGGEYACEDCGSSDALKVYEKETSFDGLCFSTCHSEGKGYKSHNTLAGWEVGAELGIVKKDRKRKKRKAEEEDTVEVPKRKVKKKAKKEKKVITKEQRASIWDKSSTKGGGFRGIRDDILKLSGVRTSTCESDGSTVTDRWYPIFQGTKEVVKKGEKRTIPNLVGYTQRIVEGKKFYPTGLNSKEVEFFNQWRYKDGGKRILIVGGQCDAMAAEQMIADYLKKKPNSAPIHVVSPTVGETSCAEQARSNYEFFDGYESIILMLDEDEAGRNATEALVDALPMSKVRLGTCPSKDPNQALLDEKDADFIRAVYNAKKPKLAGIVSGDDMWGALMQAVTAPLIPLPPALKPLQDKLCGGLPIGEIVNILAASGIGKTSFTNMMELFWIFESPYKIGVVSLEAGAGKFLMRLISSYLGKSIARIESEEDKVAFLEENKSKCYDLFFDDEGEERFCLVDDKGDLDSLAAAKLTIERLIRQGGCRIIIIDPIQDLLDSLDIESQAAFVGWQKKIKARDNVTFINVNHTRKSGGGGKAGSQGGELTEEDMQGTSALYKSGAVNIIMTRNKTSECDEERNTTKVSLAKSRDAGETGPAGELYYCGVSATLMDKEVWSSGGGVGTSGSAWTQGAKA